MEKAEELKRFEHDLKESADLRAKLEKEIRRVFEAKEATSDGEAIAKAAAELGYTITREEMERAAADLEAVDDDELESVAGGADIEPYDKSRADEDCWYDYTCPTVGRTEHGEDEYGHNAWCWTGWHCTMATLHTQTEKKVTCFADYLCVMAYRHDD